MTNEPVSPEKVEEFVELLMAHKRQVYRYILTLLPNSADADDALQESSIILWRKFAEYDPELSFSAWACGIARNVVRNFHSKRQRTIVQFDDALLDTLSGEVLRMNDELDDRQQMLRDCMDDLTRRDRDLLYKRYELGATIKSVAAAVGRPVQGLYKAMRRIHKTLFDCIERKLKAERREEP